VKPLALATWIIVIGGSVVAQFGGQARQIGTLMWFCGVVFQLAFGVGSVAQKGLAGESGEPEVAGAGPGAPLPL
jgi:hypothetical protein